MLKGKNHHSESKSKIELHAFTKNIYTYNTKRVIYNNIKGISSARKEKKKKEDNVREELFKLAWA